MAESSYVSAASSRANPHGVAFPHGRRARAPTERAAAATACLSGEKGAKLFASSRGAALALARSSVKQQTFPRAAGRRNAACSAPAGNAVAIPPLRRKPNGLPRAVILRGRGEIPGK